MHTKPLISKEKANLHRRYAWAILNEKGAKVQFFPTQWKLVSGLVLLLAFSYWLFTIRISLFALCYSISVRRKPYLVNASIQQEHY